MSDSAIQLEDTFKVVDVDYGKFEKVGRVEGLSTSVNDRKMWLDVYTEIYPVEKGKSVRVALAVVSEGFAPPAHYGDSSKDSALAQSLNLYDYVMYGKVYKVEVDAKQKNTIVFISYGGLLMKLIADSDSVAAFKMDSRIYLMMRSVE